jgi:hypothetical protein
MAEVPASAGTSPMRPGSETPTTVAFSAQHPRMTFMLKWLLAIWMILYTAFAARTVMRILVEGGSAGCSILGMSCPNPASTITGLLQAMLGGVLGAGVLGMVSFHQWVSVRGLFDARHAWGYLFAPLLGAVLGLIVFALLQSGLLIFSGNAATGSTVVSSLGYVAVGFLSGFGWYTATRRIESIVSRFFSEEDKSNGEGDQVGAAGDTERQEANDTTTTVENQG